MANQIKTEIWRTIKNFPDYAVSNYGRLKRITFARGTKPGLILKPNLTNKGYLQIGLCRTNQKRKFEKIHILVLEAFNSSRKEGKECNHKDGEKLNNFVENLEWVTPSENRQHAYSKGLIPKPRGELNPSHKLSNSTVLNIRELYKTGQYKQKQLAFLFDISYCHINKIINRKCWFHI